jgi:hypothetical protein
LKKGELLKLLVDDLVVYLTIGAVALAGGALVYFWLKEKSGKKAYKNKLNLRALHLIEEMRPARVPFFFGVNDELIHISYTLEEWQRNKNNLVRYVQGKEHRDALLDDLYDLKKRANLELIREENEPPDARSREFIQRQKDFIEHASTQIGHLEGWQPPPKQEMVLEFENLKGYCIITHEGDGVKEIAIEFQESGDFQLEHLNEAGQQLEVYAVNKSQKTAIKFSQPVEAGEIRIINTTTKAVERIPLP